MFLAIGSLDNWQTGFLMSEQECIEFRYVHYWYDTNSKITRRKEKIMIKKNWLNELTFNLTKGERFLKAFRNWNFNLKTEKVKIASIRMMTENKIINCWIGSVVSPSGINIFCEEWQFLKPL